MSIVDVFYVLFIKFIMRVWFFMVFYSLQQSLMKTEQIMDDVNLNIIILVWEF